MIKDNLNVDIGIGNLHSDVCLIAFQLEVEGILQSEIMQVFTMDAVKEISEIMLADQGEVLAPVERKQEERRAQPPLQAEADVVPIQKPAFQELHKSDKQHLPQNLELILDVPLEFSVMLGESKKTIKDILSLGTGSIVELNKLTEEPLSIYVNGKRIAEGEVVVINENFGIRITNILSKNNASKRYRKGRPVKPRTTGADKRRMATGHPSIVREVEPGAAFCPAFTHTMFGLERGGEFPSSSLFLVIIPVFLGFDLTFQESGRQ